MEGLSLINFKSYSKHNIFGFNPYINVIIGGNGQGKSNIFKGRLFL
jgi:chromosome segregation ATPase